MAETKNQEPTLPTKRKPDPNSEDGEEHQKKAQKVETLDHNSSASVEKNEEWEATLKSNCKLEVPNSKCSSVIEEGIEKVESNVVPKEGGNEDGEVDNKGGDDDEDDYEDEDEDEDCEESNEKDEVDRKGKVIIRDDKGKGKLIEEDDEDDDDSSDDGGVSDGDGDLSDDPLAEVDLNNILPSRTRRRIIHPGVYIANDLGNDDEEDDSYCSDA